MLPHLFIPCKTATLVPAFAVEDLPLARTAALILSLQLKTCPWAENTDDDSLLIIVVYVDIEVSSGLGGSFSLPIFFIKNLKE